MFAPVHVSTPDSPHPALTATKAATATLNIRPRMRSLLFDSVRRVSHHIQTGEYTTHLVEK
jgi:hypothetical protein